MIERARRQPAAFTLIELMIVVSIIAILAGAAMESYIGAQIRSKIARNRAEFKSLATAIEAYAVDNNSYPRMAHWGFYQSPEFDIVQGEKAQGILSKAISTPIAYVTRAHLMDPFMEKNANAPIDERLYTYQAIDVYIQRRPNSAFWKPARNYYGGWRLGAVGPDQIFDHGFVNSAQLPYDPTNGLISLGNLWHSNGQQVESLPPIPELLADH